MNQQERYLLYLTIKDWNKKKNWFNLKALWRTFEPWVWWGARLYYIIRNTLNGKYERVCQLYEERYLGDD